MRGEPAYRLKINLLSPGRKTGQRWILTRSATPSIALLYGQIHRQKSVPVSNPQVPPDFEGKQSAWQEGISSRFNEVGRCTSRQNSGGWLCEGAETDRALRTPFFMAKTPGCPAIS